MARKLIVICLSLAVILLASVSHYFSTPRQIILDSRTNLNIDQQNYFQASFAVSATEAPSGIEFVDNEGVQLNVPFVHQYEDLPNVAKPIIMKSACGPASLTMAFKYLGVDTDLITVINKLPTSVYVKGVQFYNLPKGAEVYGKEAVTIEPTPTAIYNALNDGHPVVLNIQNYNGILGHGVVVTGIRGYDGMSAKSLIVHDPYVGPNREFTYSTPQTLRQPEGFANYIGHLKPFYLH